MMLLGMLLLWFLIGFITGVTVLLEVMGDKNSRWGQSDWWGCPLLLLMIMCMGPIALYMWAVSKGSRDH